MADVEWKGGDEYGWKCRLPYGLTLEVIPQSGRWLLGTGCRQWKELKATEPDAAKTEAIALVRARLRETLAAAGEPDQAAEIERLLFVIMEREAELHQLSIAYDRDGDEFDVASVMAWQMDVDRKPASVAFTSGGERAAADLVEMEWHKCRNEIEMGRVVEKELRGGVGCIELSLGLQVGTGFSGITQAVTKLRTDLARCSEAYDRVANQGLDAEMDRDVWKRMNAMLDKLRATSLVAAANGECNSEWQIKLWDAVRSAIALGEGEAAAMAE